MVRSSSPETSRSDQPEREGPGLCGSVNERRHTMVAVAQASRPPEGARPQSTSPSRGHDVTMVEFRGLLPAQPAGFLDQLSESERRDVYALLGTFKEVRGLVGAGRLLHTYLKEGPLAAARGRIT